MSEASKRAARKYEKSLDSTLIRMPKGELDLIKQEAEKTGKSMNQYIMDAIRKQRS